MGCLSSLEAPLVTFISVFFLVRGLYESSMKVLESDLPMDPYVLDSKDMLMSALSVMSLIGMCSSRRAFGVFTLLFMLHAFIFALFHLFHTTVLFIKSSDDPCRYLFAPHTPDTCNIINGVTLVCNVIAMVCAGIASMAVFVRLTTVVLTINEMRNMATSRSFDNSVPQLINYKSIGSEREEDLPRQKAVKIEDTDTYFTDF
uniref:Uncharacterized protein n=1 Tax=Caenorhabditis japonica TaxID=281687 RepID=A0A8R1DPZ3_CAEJA